MRRRVGNRGGLRHPPDARLPAFRHLARLGPDESNTVGLQLADVAPRRRMRPHARVHGRRGQHRLVGGQKHGGGEIVRLPRCHFRQKVGRRRRNDDKIGIPRQPDVSDLAFIVEIEQVGEHPLVGQRPRRQRRHELLRRPRENHPDGCAALAQPADQIETLISRDAAADDEENAPGHLVCHALILVNDVAATPPWDALSLTWPRW